MLGRIEEGADFFCLDSAYLARKICDAISDKGMVPRIRSRQPEYAFRPIPDPCPQIHLEEDG